MKGMSSQAALLPWQQMKPVPLPTCIKWTQVLLYFHLQSVVQQGEIMPTVIRVTMGNFQPMLKKNKDKAQENTHWTILSHTKISQY